MGRTLMVVEDNAQFRSWLKQRLQEWFPSLTIVEAADVAEAARTAADWVPDAVVMDIHLPDGSGLGLTRRLKAELPGTNVIVCTGETSPEFRAAAFESGASHFIAKEQLLTANLKGMVEAALQTKGGPSAANEIPTRGEDP